MEMAQLKKREVNKTCRVVNPCSTSSTSTRVSAIGIYPKSDIYRVCGHAYHPLPAIHSVLDAHAGTHFGRRREAPSRAE